MGWIDQVNRYFLGAIAKRQAKHAPTKPAPLRMSPACTSRLVHLKLASQDGFIGESLILIGSLDDGMLVSIAETEPGWDAMREALDQSGRLAEPLYIAQLKLLADPDRKSLSVL